MRTLAANVFSAAALVASVATSASAMPIAPPVVPTFDAEPIHWVCNEWGQCWRQPHYYRRYGYYPYRNDNDYWPRRRGYGYGYDGPRWGDSGWRRGGDDDD